MNEYKIIDFIIPLYICMDLEKYPQSSRKLETEENSHDRSYIITQLSKVIEAERSNFM